MAEQRLRVFTLNGAPPWTGTYVRGADAIYRRRLPSGVVGEQHEIARSGELWVLRLGDHGVLARQKDTEGPFTGAGRKPWKFLATDGKFHFDPDRPMEVEVMEEDEAASDSDDGSVSPAARGRGAGGGGRGGGRGRGSAPDLGLAGVEGAEVVRSLGFDRRPEEMEAGEAVAICVRVVRGPAAGWECEGRLEVDRHHNKSTTRSTRWQFTGNGQCFTTFHSPDSSRGPSVEQNGGPGGGPMEPAAFQQLKRVKEDLRRRLAGRRDALQSAGRLINEEQEAIWQRLLAARNEGASTALLRRLKTDWLGAAPEAGGDPEWDLEHALPRAFCRKRGGDSLGQRLGRPRPSNPLRCRHRDEWLSHITRGLREERQAAKASGGASGSDAEGGGSGTEGAGGGSGRKRRRAEMEAAAGAEDAPGTEEEPNGAAKEPAVPLRRLLAAAAEDEFLNTRAAVIWERLAGGAVGAAGGDGFAEADCDVAWRYAVALAALGHADAQFHTAVVDLARESQRHGMSPERLLARLLVLKDALLKGAVNVEGFANVLRPLVAAGLAPPAAAEPVSEERLASQALLGLAAECGPEALGAALLGAAQAPVPALCAFAARLCGGAGAAKVLAEAAAETIPQLLRADAPWPCWCRGLAALLGAALAGCEAALEALLGYVRGDAPWPASAPRGGKWELWLLLAASPMGERAMTLPAPEPVLERAMPIWEDFLKHFPQARRLVVAAAPLVPERCGSRLLSEVKGGKSSGSQLEKVFRVWGEEAAMLREELERGGARSSRMEAYATSAAMAAMALRLWHLEGQRSSRAAAAATCLAESLGLLLAPGAGREAAKQARCLVETNCGSPLAGKDWPISLPSNDQRFHSEGEGGHHLSNEGKLAHLRGRPFGEVYRDRKLVEWMLKRHMEHWQLAGAPAAEEAAHSARNPEINRFALWLLGVFAGDAPLLHLPQPPAQSVESKLLDASQRAALVCRSIFAPLLTGLQQRRPEAPAPAGVPSWLRAAALAAALRAGCLGLADPQGEVASAAQELLGVLAGADRESDGRPANAAVAQAAKLESPQARAFVLACFARDCHILLQWLQRLGTAGEQRAAWLFRLVAAAARHLQGRWPPPPACPSEAWAPSLAYNPLQHSAPPGSPPSAAVSARLLRLRPLSALLAYKEPPAAAPADGRLASLRGLEAFVGAYRPDAAQISIEDSPPEFGIWAEALSGSDVEDFVRLRGWRLRTLEALGGAARSQLAAAVSSRCVAVHCVVAIRRASKQGARPGAVAELLLCLLRDLGEASGAEVLKAHRRLVQTILAHSEAADEDLWAARHLLYRYSALDRLVHGLSEAERAGLPAEVRTALRHLHLWVQRDGFVDDKSADVEALAQRFAAELVSLQIAAGDQQAHELIVEEIAPPPRSEDGCFGGVAVVASHCGKDVLKALWKVSGKSALEALAASPRKAAAGA